MGGTKPICHHAVDAATRLSDVVKKYTFICPITTARESISLPNTNQLSRLTKLYSFTILFMIIAEYHFSTSVCPKSFLNLNQLLPLCP